MNTLKADALKAIEQLPDEADIDDIMYKLYVIEKVRKGKQAAEKGEFISHDDLKQEIQKW